ncbi:MAG: hypothetical protein H6823_16470 [Planctomycetaceae bacterium]|nr:hypothetical protein [Planctomycetales bacterium]MCB9939834.1 hypothetical protein [Planctomycetaceae bacterium]
MLNHTRLTALLIVFAGFGVTHIQSLAQEPEAATEQPTSAGEAIRDQITDFAAKLQVGGDQSLSKFQQTLGTEPGVIVVNDRAARRAADVLAKAQANALTDYLKLHFEQSGDGYALRDGQQEYREAYLKSSERINKEIEAVAAAIRETTPKIDAETDATKLLVRFLESEGAAPMFYFVVQPYLRPGGALIDRELGKVFVRGEQGKYVIRAGRRPDAEQFVERSRQQTVVISPLQKEMSAWAKDLATPDDFHKRMQAAFADPLFAVLVATKIYEKGNQPGQASMQVNKFFEGLENACRDTVDGLVVRDEAQADIDKLLTEFARAQQASEQVRPMLTQYADRIQADDDLHRQWAELLRGDLAAAMFGPSYEAGKVTPEVAIQATLAKMFTEQDGRLKMISQNEEEIEKFASKMFRDYRDARRRGHSVTEFAAKITDPEMRDAFASTGGKFVMATEAKQALSEINVEGFALWRHEFFESTDAGYVAKAAAFEEVRSILADVEKVGEELKKDDF